MAIEICADDRKYLLKLSVNIESQGAKKSSSLGNSQHMKDTSITKFTSCVICQHILSSLFFQYENITGEKSKVTFYKQEENQ